MADLEATYVTLVIATFPGSCYAVQYAVAYVRSDMPWHLVASYTLAELTHSLLIIPLNMKALWVCAELFRAKPASRAADLA
eukprot:7211697-Heterocapsa_arctica.AAC.1